MYNVHKIYMARENVQTLVIEEFCINTRYAKHFEISLIPRYELFIIVWKYTQKLQDIYRKYLFQAESQLNLIIYLIEVEFGWIEPQV